MPQIWMRVPPFARTGSGLVGFVMLAMVLLLAFCGPLFAPHAFDATVAAPATGPSSGAPLGTDFLGRDVLSRTLDGGTSVIELAVAATVATYTVGICVGMIAGYSRSLVDPFLMRFVDLLLSFPALLILLVLVTGAGNGAGVLIIGVMLVLFPGVARLVRTATLEVSTMGYVAAAVARGEPGRAIMLREIFPNILPSIVADLGIRFAGAIIFIASLNYLGLGRTPPAADWGLMVSENRGVITENVWAVLAPVVMLALLTISVNLVGDAYARSLGRSAVTR